MKQAILAVSGGIDSVVMLHMLRNDPGVVVAHFDHGIRENSKEDVEFVKRLIKSYGLKLFLGVGELGKDANEAAAREARWKFLRDLATTKSGVVYTAHHRDDIAETVAINTLRGTGWRGLAVMDERTVRRPLIGWTKRDIFRYAAKHNLRWKEDPTNYTDAYLRNRLRKRLTEAKDTKLYNQIAELSKEQRRVAVEIDNIVGELMSVVSEMRDEGLRVRRSTIKELSSEIAYEVLRKALQTAGRPSATRPQLDRLLDDVRKLAAGKKISFGAGYFVRIERDWIVF